MDKLCGIGTCNRFRQLWMAFVPHIVSVSKTKRTKEITNLLKSARFNNYEHDFGNDNSIKSLCRLLIKSDLEVRSRAAMELLPMVMVGKKKGPIGRRHFIDYREVQFRKPNYSPTYTFYLFCFRNRRI